MGGKAREIQMLRRQHGEINILRNTVIFSCLRYLSVMSTRPRRESNDENNRNEARKATKWTRNERRYVECALFDPLSWICAVARVSFHRFSRSHQAVGLYLDLSRSHLTSATSTAAPGRTSRVSRGHANSRLLSKGVLTPGHRSYTSFRRKSLARELS